VIFGERGLVALRSREESRESHCIAIVAIAFALTAKCNGARAMVRRRSYMRRYEWSELWPYFPTCDLALARPLSLPVRLAEE